MLLWHYPRPTVTPAGGHTAVRYHCDRNAGSRVVEPMDPPTQIRPHSSIVLCCATVQRILCPDSGLKAGWSEGEEKGSPCQGDARTTFQKDATVHYGRNRHLVGGTATRDELPKYQARTRDGQIHRFLTASTLLGWSQSGCLKPPQASVYSWHSPGPGRTKSQFGRLYDPYMDNACA